MNCSQAFIHPRPTCSIAGCERVAQRLGLCKRHYLLRLGHPKCSIDDCDEPLLAKSFCTKHYKRWKLYGDPLAGWTFKGAPKKYLDEVVMPHDGEECIYWPFARNFVAEGKNVIIFRHVCELAHGPAPTNGMEACHSCGMGHANCVNKRHLRWDSHSGNMADTITHGTSGRGEMSGHAKLTRWDVHKIRRMLESHPQRKVADEFGVCQMTISNIATRKTWGWLE